MGSKMFYFPLVAIYCKVQISAAWSTIVLLN